MSVVPSESHRPCSVVPLKTLSFGLCNQGCMASSNYVVVTQVKSVIFATFVKFSVDCFCCTEENLCAQQMPMFTLHQIYMFTPECLTNEQ